MIFIILTVTSWQNALTGNFNSDSETPKRKKNNKSERKSVLGSDKQKDLEEAKSECTRMIPELTTRENLLITFGTDSLLEIFNPLLTLKQTDEI